MSDDQLAAQEHVLILASYAPSLLNFRGSLLREMLKARITVSVGAPGIDDMLRRQLEALGVSVHDTPLQRNGTGILADLQYHATLFRLICQVRPNIVLTYTIKPNIWGSFAAARARVPSFALVTGLGYAFTDADRASVKQWITRAIARRLYRAATSHNAKVIFQNPDDRDDFLAEGCVEDFSKVRIVNGSGVDLDHYRPTPLPEAPVFVMIARLLINKGVREYAKAAMSLLRTHPAARCLLAGPFDEGPNGIAPDDLKRWQRAGLEYLGPLNDVRPAITESRVCVLTSYREGTPRSVLEAMAMGRPVITTDAPGCRETVQHGVNGYLVPVRDSEALAARMRDMIDAPVRTSEMGQESLRIAREKYDVRKVNKQMMEHLGLLKASATDAPLGGDECRFVF